MKKKVITISAWILASVLLMVAIIYDDYENKRPKMPYADLTTSEIDYINAISGIYVYHLNQEEIEEFVKLLNQIVIYEKSDTPKGLDSGTYMGYAKVVKKNGKSFDIEFESPYVVIDGQGYICETAPCNNADTFLHKRLVPQAYTDY